MAQTLTEAAKFTTDKIVAGIIRVIIKDSPVLQKMQFTDVVGNAYTYNRETTLGGANWYNPGEVWIEGTGTVTQKTATIKILGGDADVDEFIKKTRSNITDIEAETIESKAKDLQHTYLDAFYYSDSASDARAIDGVHKICQDSSMTGQILSMGSGSTGAALSMAKLDQLVDLARDGNYDVLIMNRNLRRRITQYVRANGGLYQEKRDDFGNFYMVHNGVPIFIDDFLTQTETIASGVYSAKTGGATASIFGVKFGTKDLLGLQNGGINKEKIGNLPDKDAHRWRIKWYNGLALLRTFSLARLDGITDIAVVA